MLQAAQKPGEFEECRTGSYVPSCTREVSINQILPNLGKVSTLVQYRPQNNSPVTEALWQNSFVTFGQKVMIKSCGSDIERRRLQFDRRLWKYRPQSCRMLHSLWCFCILLDLEQSVFRGAFCKTVTFLLTHTGCNCHQMIGSVHAVQAVTFSL